MIDKHNILCYNHGINKFMHGLSQNIFSNVFCVQDVEIVIKANSKGGL